LTAFARGSFRGNRLLTTFREPYLFGRKLALFVTGFREEEEREGFAYIRYGGLLQTALRAGEHRGLILRFGYEKTHQFDVTVPKGRLFVLGDHRSDSGDSRVHLSDPGQGTIPTSDVIGRAVLLVWPFSRFSTLPVPATFNNPALN